MLTRSTETMTKLGIKSSLLAILGLTTFSSVVWAGSSATNTYRNGWERGERQVNVTNITIENGYQVNESGALKFETNFPNATGEINYDGDLSGKIRVSTRGPDPFVEGVFSNQYEEVSSSSETLTELKENTNFGATIYTHTIEADSF